MPARHAKLVRDKTKGLSFPNDCTIASNEEVRSLQELTGLIVEDALTPVEEEVILMILILE